MIVAAPAHIRQLAEDVSAEGRSVLADWCEEQGEIATAESLRGGGYAAQIVMLSLLARRPEEPEDAVIYRGSLAFEWCHVELSYELQRVRVDSVGSRGLKICRARVSGLPRPQSDARSVGDLDPVTFLVGDRLVTVRPHEWNWSHNGSTRGMVEFDVIGELVSRERVNRRTGATIERQPETDEDLRARLRAVLALPGADLTLLNNPLEPEYADAEHLNALAGLYGLRRSGL